MAPRMPNPLTANPDDPGYKLTTGWVHTQMKDKCTYEIKINY